MGKRIKALIFDFDGLILETEAPVYKSWCEVYERYGLTLPLCDVPKRSILTRTVKNILAFLSGIKKGFVYIYWNRT